MESIHSVFFTEGLAVSGGHPRGGAAWEKEGELAHAATGMSGVQTKSGTKKKKRMEEKFHFQQ